jgi:pimeloyl-ACP methyl ester carboxylesterase
MLAAPAHAFLTRDGTRVRIRCLMHALVLIPGLLCDQALWSHQIAAFGGYVKTAVADITGQSTLAEMAEAVLDKAPAHFSLAGFSLGGQVALEIMQAAPQRVERLALLSTTRGGLLPASQIAIREAIATVEGGGFEEYLETSYRANVAERRYEDAKLKRCFLHMAHTVGKDGGLRQMQALLAITGPFPNLDQIRCPTVVVGGEEDRRTTPAADEALAREIPASELVFIRESGHFTTLEQPAMVTDVLRHWMTL